MVEQRTAPTTTRFLSVAEKPNPSIADAFKGLAMSITIKNPVVINSADGSAIDSPKKEPLSPKERELIRLINDNTTPDGLVDIIFQTRPSVYATSTPELGNTIAPIRPPVPITVEPAPDIDRLPADRPYQLPNDLSEIQREGLETRIIATCRNYLKAGKITDGFDESQRNNRGLWVLGVERALREITNDESNKPLHDGRRQDWSLAFNDRWNDNKYSQGKRTAVISNLLMSKILTLPVNLQTVIDASIEKVQKADPIFKSGEIDIATDMIAEACRDILNFLAKK